MIDHFGAFDGKLVLVTGGCGFIGHHVVEKFASLGARITVLDDLSSGSINNLDGISGDVHLIRGSILNESKVKKASKGVSFIVHLAAQTSVAGSVENPEKVFLENVEGSFLLLDTVKRFVKRVVFSSSCSVYGETSLIPLCESIYPVPVSPYAASKVSGEALANAFSKSFGMEVFSLRFFNVYGPGQRLDSSYAAAIPSFVSKAITGEDLPIYGDGKQTRDFVHVSNVAAAVLSACVSPFPDCNNAAVINVGSGVETSIQELALIILRLTESTSLMRHFAPRAGDVRRSFASTDLLKTILGIRECLDLETGLCQLIAKTKISRGSSCQI